MARLSAVWPPSVGSTASGLLALDDPHEHLDVERLHVGGVGELGVRHDRGRVRVGQDHPVALLAEDLAGLGAGVVELAGLADHDRAGADQEDRLDVGALRHQATPRSGCGRPGSTPPVSAHDARVTPSTFGELLEQVGAVVRPRPRLGVVLHAERRGVEDPEALAHAVVEVHVAHLGPPAQRVGVDGEVVVLAGDLHLAGGEVAHRVVPAVVAERELHRGAAEGAAEQLVAEADPEDRHLRRAAPQSRRWRRAPRPGSPGPLDRNTPAGSRASTSAAGVDAGTTSTSTHWPRCRRIVRLMPKS